MSGTFDIFCAEASLALAEPLAGTAAHATLLVCVEDRNAWAPRPPRDWAIDATARQHVEDFLDRHPKARLQLVKRCSHDGGGEGPLSVFLVDTRPETAALWRMRIEHHGQLADLDLEGFALGAPPAEAERLREPLVLVCTHGKRDRCCARHGMALIRALEDHPGHDRVWQTSHLGGHRFAATAVTLPSGYCYGRLQPSDAAGLVDAADAGRLPSLPRLRGRMAWPEPVQTADAHLRGALEELGEQALRLVAAEELDPARWQVTFEHARTGKRHRVLVERRERPEQRPPSCGTAPEGLWSWVPVS